MEQLKSMKQCLMAQVQGQMGNLQAVDAKELGEAIDMIKDLEEAIYYCTIVEAMEKNKAEENRMPQNNNVYYYSESPSSNGGGYSGGRSGSYSSGGGRNYSERYMPIDWDMRDEREGQSPKYRRMYMESKAMHQKQEKKMEDLEKYLQELSKDITEMVADSSPEEKQMLHKKLSTLATKVSV